jgi:hypothetical protein
MKPFLSFQGSRACFFSNLFAGESCPLRIPFDRLRAAVSPIPKSRKEQRPPASLSGNDFMVSPVRGIRVKKEIRDPYMSVLTALRQ